MSILRRYCGFLVLISTALAAETPIAGETLEPIPFPKDRYAAMRVNSPFALASPAAPTPTPEAGFAANWYVSGIGRVGDEDFVTIKARDLSTQFSLFGREAHENGVALASVNWSDTIGKSTVILRRGNETAKLEFNQAELRNPPQVTSAHGAVAPQKPQTAVSGAPPVSNAPQATPGGVQPPVIQVRRRLAPIPAPSQTRQR